MRSRAGVDVVFTQGWQFLVHQQFYVEPDLMVDRRKQHAIRVEGAGEVVSQMVKQLQDRMTSWDQGLSCFVESYCQLLGLNSGQVLNRLATKFSVEPVELQSWYDQGFEEGQIFMFIASMLWETYLLRQLREVFERLGLRSELGRRQVASRLSLLKNVVVLQLMAEELNLNGEVLKVPQLPEMPGLVKEIDHTSTSGHAVPPNIALDRYRLQVKQLCVWCNVQEKS